jgi:hypothetical protein
LSCLLRAHSTRWRIAIREVPAMPDRQFVVSGKWALAADRLQWMVQRRVLSKGRVTWHSVSFVASTRDVLARCLREKGCPPADAERLLAGLPSTFAEWAKTRRVAPKEPVLVDGEAPIPESAD